MNKLYQQFINNYISSSYNFDMHEWSGHHNSLVLLAKALSDLKPYDCITIEHIHVHNWIWVYRIKPQKRLTNKRLNNEKLQFV